MLLTCCKYTDIVRQKLFSRGLDEAETINDKTAVSKFGLAKSVFLSVNVKTKP